MDSGKIRKLFGESIPWSFLGFLMAAIFGILAIYSVFFYIKAPKLKLDVLSNAPVFSIREDASSLDFQIIFKGENIRRANKALSVITVKLLNEGNVSIRSGDFDVNNPFAITAQNVTIIESDCLNTSEKYLDRVCENTKVSKRSITFPPFIMEPGNFITLRLLTIHKEGIRPALGTKGKIANVKEVSVVTSSTTTITTSRWRKSISGDLIIQIIRTLIYLIFPVGFLMLLLFLTAIITERINRSRDTKNLWRISAEVDVYLDYLNEDIKLKLEPLLQYLNSGTILFFIFRIINKNYPLRGSNLIHTDDSFIHDVFREVFSHKSFESAYQSLIEDEEVALHIRHILKIISQKILMIRDPFILSNVSSYIGGLRLDKSLNLAKYGMRDNVIFNGLINRTEQAE